MHPLSWTWRQMIGMWLVGAFSAVAAVLALRAYGARAMAEEHRLFLETAKAHGIQGADTAEAVLLVLSGDEALQQRHPTRWLRLASNAAAALVLAILVTLTIVTLIWLWSHRQHVGVGSVPPAA